MVKRSSLITEDKTWHVEGNVDFLTDVAVYINSSSAIGLEYKVYSDEDTDFILSDAMTQQTVEIRVYL